MTAWGGFWAVGGYAGFDGNATSSSASASHNEVVIENTLVNYYISATHSGIYGGYIAKATDNTPNTANHNKVTIGKDSLLTKHDYSEFNLYGGFINGGGASPTERDAYTGNTLSLAGGRGGDTHRITNLGNFEKLHFLLTDEIGDGNTLLHADFITLTQDAPDPTTAKYGVTAIDMTAGNTMAKDDVVTLLKAETWFHMNTALDGTTVSGTKGLSQIADFELIHGAGTDILQARLLGLRDNERIEKLLDGQLATLAFINEVSDLVVRQAAYEAEKEEAGPISFITSRGGKSNYYTGTTIEVQGFHFLTGLGHSFHLNEGADGKFIVASFFETGSGSYELGGPISGGGNTHYHGGGVFAHYSSPLDFHIDASLRGGRVNTEFSSDEMLETSPGRSVDYEINTPYYAAHVSLGKVWTLNDSLSLNTFTKYLWAKHEGGNVNIMNEKYHFNSVDSHRWRNGARLTYEVTAANEGVAKLFVGATHDYEFSGKAKGKVNGKEIGEMSLQGSTFIMETGVSLSHPDYPVSLDFDVAGYTGKRDGLSATAGLRFEF